MQKPIGITTRLVLESTWTLISIGKEKNFEKNITEISLINRKHY